MRHRADRWSRQAGRGRQAGSLGVIVFEGGREGRTCEMKKKTRRGGGAERKEREREEKRSSSSKNLFTS